MSNKRTPIPPPPARLEAFVVVLMKERTSISSAGIADYHRVPVAAENTLQARHMAAVPGWRPIAVCRPGDPLIPEELAALHRAREATVDPREKIDPWERVLPSVPV